MDIRKVLSVLLISSMLLSPSVSAIPEIGITENEVAFTETEIPKQKSSSGKCGENLTCTLDSSGTLTISGTGNMADYEYGDAPWCPKSSSVEKTVIENGVTSIGEWAF